MTQTRSNKIEWEKWHVFWVDERCVPLDDPESNFGGAYETLFKDVPIPRENLHAIGDGLYEGERRRRAVGRGVR